MIIIMFVIDPDLEHTINIMGALKEKAVSHFEVHLLGRIKGKACIVTYRLSHFINR